MPTPGWYPDPQGSAGQYRYWDGQAWSTATTNAPESTPAPTDSSMFQTPATRTARGSRGWLIAIIAIVVVIGIVVAIAVTRGSSSNDSGGSAAEDTNTSRPSGSQWDENNSPSTPPPSPNPTQASSVACPVTTAQQNTAQSSNKVSGGNLQFDPVSGWDTDNSFYLDWVSDLHSQSDDVYLGWQSNVAVGALNAQDGFTTMQGAAQATIECFASSGYYQGFTGRKDLTNEQTTIAGHAAWRIQSEVYVSNFMIPQTKGDRVDIYVVDVGQADHFGVFIGCSDLGDTDRNAKVDAAVASLQVTG